MPKFWNWQGSNELYINGYISDEQWFADDVAPKLFKVELSGKKGDIVVWINSSGGDVFAAHEIYNALKEYPGKVTVKIDALAASAASVIAMSGDEVLISPVGYIFIHNPLTVVQGNTSDLEKGIDMLSSIKEGILNAYQLKTGLSREELSRMMDAESTISAQDAVRLGFADGILYTGANILNKKLNLIKIL